MKHAVSHSVIDWPAAQAAATAAVQAAQAMDVRVNVALVDASGILAGFLRMPGAPLHSIDIAIDKAYTAASFGLPTARWSEVLQSHSPAVREGLVQRPRFVAFGGGVPIVEGGQCIGAIGVSGGSEQQDEQIAQAGLAALDLA
ncbi:GlcG/HbpS family heme-binding protein [Hydrogenophaga sp. BPS33]|uniref:GlcG/HbpS family heme-binding protein n=1 Tax=Hydrogenophaga sp. BPS33 TaxID=2651974 RepID=UPI0013203EAA|nr:heme-binding protein [Hydrogenophaga sp. BPS33]QHE83873.1 heme-binding protein [Hydrogenophaga sp. BPS33]